MKPATQSVTRTMHRAVLVPSHVEHESFADKKKAVREFAAKPLLEAAVSYDEKYMPDEVTRDHARRMHYAAHRMHVARTKADLARWQASYLALRDCIVLGNRKLIYRAVRRRMAIANRADDMIGDCHIVLIQAVAAYNPWLGVRFSTYAYTCLVRALARLSMKLSTDWLTKSLSLESLPDGEPRGRGTPEPTPVGLPRVDEYLRDDHPLLSDREKVIITRRFGLSELPTTPTLETVGAELGLSKERVRQVQASALGKLRLALLEPNPVK